MSSTTTANRASALGVVGIGLALVLALVLMMLSSAVTRATPSGQGTLWLTDRNGAGTVSAYDASGTLIGWVWVGQNPIGVVGSPRTNRIYATNEGSGSNSISVIDADSITVLATIPTGPRPHHMQISPDGRYLYFGEFNTSKVGVLDTETHALREYPTAEPGNTTARTHSVWPTADGKYLYAANSDVANTASNGFVVKLDASDGSILWSLMVGNQPSDVTVAPNGRIGYVTVRGEGVVKVLDLETPSVIGSVAVGTQPDTLLLTPDGKLLTVTLRGNPAQMTIVDTRTLTATIVTLTGSLAGHHDISPDGRFSYVAVEGGTNLPPGIAVVDNQSAAQVGFIQHQLPGAKPACGSRLERASRGQFRPDGGRPFAPASVHLHRVRQPALRSTLSSMTDGPAPEDRVWEVFRQEAEGDPMIHGGNVSAPDEELAVHYAREFYGRRQESHRLWVVPREAIVELDDPDLLKPPFDRSFKRPGGYLIKHKLEAAKARAGTPAGATSKGGEVGE